VPEKLHVLIADDHDLLRQALKLHVEMLGESVKVSEARSYDEVISILSGEGRKHPPRLIVLDLHMPGNSSVHVLDGLQLVIATAPGASVAIFSGTEDPVIVRAALKLGLKGYIPKTTSGRSLISALNFILDGGVYVPSVIMNEVNALQENKDSQPAEESALSQLTVRELAALKSLTLGFTNKEIGREMGLQDVTVKMHLRNAYRKIGASNRIEAVRIALALGIDSQPVEIGQSQ